MTILPALSIRCSSVVKGGPGSWKSALYNQWPDIEAYSSIKD